MLKLTGTLVNIFTPARRPEDEHEPVPKAQILGEVGLPTGEFRKDLVTIGIKSNKLLQQLEQQIGSDVVLDVGVFAPSKGSVIYFTRAD